MGWGLGSFLGVLNCHDAPGSFFSLWDYQSIFVTDFSPSGGTVLAQVVNANLSVERSARWYSACLLPLVNQAMQ